MRAARLKTSFLNSGLTLEGTPQNVLSDTYNVGLQDIDQIKTNANLRAKNAISSARTKAISALSSAAMSASGGFGGGGELGSGFSSAFGNQTGQTVGRQFSSSPIGPYQPLGGF